MQPLGLVLGQINTIQKGLSLSLREKKNGKKG